MRELIDAMQDNYSKWQTREGIKNLPEFSRPNEETDVEAGACAPAWFRKLTANPIRSAVAGGWP